LQFWDAKGRSSLDAYEAVNASMYASEAVITNQFGASA